MTSTCNSFSKCVRIAWFRDDEDAPPPLISNKQLTREHNQPLKRKRNLALVFSRLRRVGYPKLEKRQARVVDSRDLFHVSTLPYVMPPRSCHNHVSISHFVK